LREPARWFTIGPMPSVQGLSKEDANYRPGKPGYQCRDCRFMWPRLAVGGCRYVRGVIHPDDTCNEFTPRAERPETTTPPSAG